MTHRERLERKAERRRDWAEGREAKATRHFNAAHHAVAGIPLGQPILVGHHSEKRHRAAVDRCHRNMSAGCESQDMAKHHASAAAGIADQLDRAIYSDDSDAIDQLRARIAENEEKRERMKRVNALFRKGDAVGLATMGLDLERLRAKVASIGLSFVKAPFEGYQLTNLGARIRADRERIALIERETAQRERVESAIDSAPRGVADGVGFSLVIVGQRATLVFDSKPNAEVRAKMKEHYFRWDSVGGAWVGPADRVPFAVETL